MATEYFPDSFGMHERFHGAFTEAELYNSIIIAARDIVEKQIPFNHKTPECFVLENFMQEMTFRVDQNLDGYPLFAQILDILKARRERGDYMHYQPVIAECIVTGGLKPVDAAAVEKRKQATLIDIKYLPDEELHNSVIDISQQILKVRSLYKVQMARESALLRMCINEIIDRNKNNNEQKARPLLSGILDGVLSNISILVIAESIAGSGLTPVAVPERTGKKQPVNALRLDK